MKTFEYPEVKGTTIRFVWQADDPPEVIGDFDHWGSSPLRFQRSNKGRWTAEVEVMASAYIEYAFVHNGDRLLDPLNPRAVPNGIGQVNNVVTLPEYKPSPWKSRPAPSDRGRLSEHMIHDALRLVGGKRRVWLYESLGEDPTPLLVVLDGQGYLRRGKIIDILDNLIAAEEIPPVSALLIANHPTARGVEYACSGATAECIKDVAIPFAVGQLKGRFNGTIAVVGASMGGLMATYMGVAYPETFQAVISQSGAFKVGYGYALLHRYIETGAVPPTRFWFDVGRYEFLLHGNQSLRDLMQKRAYDFTYREFSGGHNYTCWRDHLSSAITAIFGDGLGNADRRPGHKGSRFAPY